MFKAPSKKAFIRNLSCSQKRNVSRAWQYIETHLKININNFFTKVVGYIKSMENQLWIWGYYRYGGEFNEGLINATNFSIVSSNVDIVAEKDDGMEYVEEFGEELEDDEERVSPIIMEAVITENGGVDYVLQNSAKGLGLHDLTKDVFEHIQSEWITKVTPDLFCVHRLENRIHENVMSPFKKLRDLLTLSKGKLQKQNLTIVSVLNKIMDLEHFTLTMFNAPSKKAFIRNLSCSQKRNVLRAWQYIETHPKININNFFTKVVGYIKSMENQLWIWGYYRYGGEFNEGLINATNFSIVSSNVDIVAEKDDGMEYVEEFGEELEDDEERVSPIIMEAVITENGGVDYVLQNSGYKK
ncbi:unnamed protein product [Phaedon cochleariae]|uniref:Uncharacterized protein n=1 Tax=Phaedon cochleariae TaxID=80249 RepID=A0A9N9SFN5_PHACE|nr:unnamed protein product [Phaedon cochleariae]